MEFAATARFVALMTPDDGPDMSLVGRTPFLSMLADAAFAEAHAVLAGPVGVRAGALEHVAGIAREIDADHVGEEAEALAARLGEGRFFVACLGQFKRGRSTLINALLEHDLLPTGVLPVTAVVTVVRWGEHASARVRLRDGDWRPIALGEVADYVAEDRNPENAKGVMGVEVFAPSVLLRGGMCLVDTPGIGSVFAENTGATRDFVPHIDAVLVVLGADPPISGAELDSSGGRDEDRDPADRRDEQGGPPHGGGTRAGPGLRGPGGCEAARARGRSSALRCA